MPSFMRKIEFDDYIASKVMGWELWQGDWYEPWSREHQRRRFCAVRTWSPTSDPAASQLVWLKCLEQAKRIGYEIRMELDDDGRIHIHGDHPVGRRRLLAIDKDLNYAICLMSLELFDLKPKTS